MNELVNTAPLDIADSCECEPVVYEYWISCCICGCSIEEKGDGGTEHRDWFASQIDGWGMIDRTEEGYTSKHFYCPDCLEKHIKKT